MVLTKTKAKADQAKAELEDGKSFKVVSKKYSIDQASKAQGGKLPDLAKGKQDPALDKAAFSAKKGEVHGPVKTQFGYYVFQVTAVKAASQQSLAQARDTIRNLLRSQREQKALDSFVKDFRKKYKEKTNCGEDYRVAECKNAPKSSTETAPGGAAPQGPRRVLPRRVPRRRAPPRRVPRRRVPRRRVRRRRPLRSRLRRPPRAAAPHRRRRSRAIAVDPTLSPPSNPSNPEGALARLDAITRRLRVECPWDREQDERSIVPHTVEEAYELADAAHSGDDAKLVDELGDVLFQVYFLSLLLEERGAGSLEAWPSSWSRS